MKQLTLILLMVSSFSFFAQNKMLIVKAKTKNAFIVEGNHEKTGWTISPEIKPDVYTLAKSPKAKWVKFYTDIDSVKVKLKPNEKFDFIVLLNNKDSCFTRFESLALKNYKKLSPEIHDTIPFVLTEYHNIKLKVVLNKKDTLFLMFDTGADDISLINEVLKKHPYLKGMDKSRVQIGNQNWDDVRTDFEELSGHTTDGLFGWNLFDGKIVEIDYDKNVFIVHSSLKKVKKEYQKFDIEYIRGLFFIEGELEHKGQKYPNRFLFDSGYQRTIMLDRELMQEQSFPKDELVVIKKVIMKDITGKEIPVLTVQNERLRLGKMALENIPVQLLSTSNPSRVKAHILGNEVLKRFNTILDFQNNLVYLKPNSLYNLPYVEQK